MEYIEVTGKTVNDAITKACIDLGIPSSELDIQVISEGSKGFFGIGNKPAVIKVAKKEEEKPAEVKKAPAPARKEKPVKEEKPEMKAPVFDVKKEEPAEKPAVSEEKPEEKPVENRDAAETEKPKSRNNRRRNHKKHSSGEKSEEQRAASAEVRKPEKPEVVEKTEEEIAEMKERAGKFLTDVFEAMDLSVNLSMNYVPEGASFEIDLSGDDMGVLIGKRGQTLDSLQYLTSLVVNKGHKDYVRIKLDTEDYRRRRKETLENLAKNIANKVKKTRKTVVLEPMNPYERRIIHSALQPNKYVETYSEGNEPYRHVVVTLKKQ